MKDDQNTLTWDEIAGRSAQDLIREVVQYHKPVTIVAPGEETVTIAPEVSSHRAASWEQERVFLNALLAQGPVEGGRTWTREDLHDR